MITDAERAQVKQIYGADDRQVARDHLLSHMLAALSDGLAGRVRLFGGTALARTFLAEGRLSEDVDLIAVGPRAEVAAEIEAVLRRRLSRDFGRPSIAPTLGEARPTQPVTVSFVGGLAIQIQLLPEDHYPPWPFEVRELQQRYADAAPAVLPVPTLASFVAWKTAAFIDRGASRDLWDLAALATREAFSVEAADLFRRFGPYTSLPTDTTLPAAPTEDVWQRDLAHQARLRLTAADARRAVLRAWQAIPE